MRFTHHVSLAALASVAMFAGVASADYTFIKVADSSGPLGTNWGWPDINDSGTVVFWSVLDDGVNTAIYTGNGGRLTPQVSTLRTFSKLEFPPVINNAGVVAFWAETPPVHARGIYTVLNGVVTPVANDQNSLFYDFNYFLGINDSGAVVYNGMLFNPCCIAAFGIGASVMYDADGPFSSFGPGTINNNGVAVFGGSFDGGGSSGIFTGSGAGFTTIATSGAMFTSIDTPAEINDSGAGAFAAVLVGGGQGIFIGSGGPLTTVATTAGAYDLFTRVGMNNNGDVAFYAFRDNANPGIFTGPDPTTDAVIEVGDQLFGSTVYGLNFAHGINNHGDIVFTYVLENASGGAGISGVAIAKAPRTALVGDIDGDGDVDAADLAFLLGAWGSNNPAADLNGDGVVNAADLALLLGSWT